VEVKKKRGNVAKRHSIWGDLDLAVIANDRSSAVADAAEPELPQDVMEPEVAIARAQPDEVGETAISAKSDSLQDCETEQVEQPPAVAMTEVTEQQPAATSRRWASRRSEKTLPRGQRWKRRLPKGVRH
jgi:hypothetical protein